MTNGTENEENRLTEAEQARREFFISAGKFALYTAPLMILLMKPTTSAIAASAGVPQTTDSNDDEPHDTSDSNESNSPDNSGSNGFPSGAGTRRHHGFWLWRLLGFSD